MKAFDMLRRFEITYGPTEFEHFESVDECLVDMSERLAAAVEQEGYKTLRALIKFDDNSPRIRIVAIAREHVIDCF